MNRFVVVVGADANNGRERYNEYIMTSLRTMWGVDAAEIQAYGADFFRHFETIVSPYIQAGNVAEMAGKYRLTLAGKLLADRIAADLFLPN